MPKTDFKYPRFESLQSDADHICPKLIYEKGFDETHLFDSQSISGDSEHAHLTEDIPTYTKTRLQIKQTVRFYPDFDRSTDRYVYAVENPEHWANYRAYRYSAELLRRPPHSVTDDYVRQFGNLEWYTPRYMAFDRITYQDTLIDQPQAHVDRLVDPQIGLFYPVSDEYLARYKAELLAQRIPYRFDWPREFDIFGEEPGDYTVIGHAPVLPADIFDRLPALDNYNYYNDQEFTHMRYVWNWLDRATLNDPVVHTLPQTPEEMDATLFPSLEKTMRAALTVAESKVQGIRRIINLQPEPEQRFHTLDYQRPFDMWDTHRQKDPSIEQLCYEPTTSEYLILEPEWSPFPIAVYNDPDCIPMPGFPDGNRPLQWNLTTVRYDRSVEHITVFAETRQDAVNQIIGEYYAVSANPINPIGEHYIDTFDRIDQLLRFYTNRIEFARFVGTPELVKQYDPVFVGLEKIDTFEPRLLDSHVLEVDRWQSIVVGASPNEQPRIDGEASYPWGQVFDADPLEDRQFELDTFNHLRVDIPVKTVEPDPVQTTIESYHIVLPFSIQHDYMDAEVEMDCGRLLDSSAYSFHSWNDTQHPYMPRDYFHPEKCSLKQWFRKVRPEEILDTHPNVIFNGNVPITSDNVRRPVIEVTFCEGEAPCTSLLPGPPRPDYKHAPSFAAINPFDDNYYGVRHYEDHAATDFVDETYGNGMAHIYKDTHPLDLNQADIPELVFNPLTLSWNLEAILEPLEGERRLDGNFIEFAPPSVLQPYQEQSTFLIAPVWIEINRRLEAPVIEVTVDRPIIAVDIDGSVIAIETDSPIMEVERIID